jgi:hypothetical protein
MPYYSAGEGHIYRPRWSLAVSLPQGHSRGAGQIGRYLGSIGNWARCHSCQPPLSAYRLVNPFSASFCAARALVNSLGQAQ